MIILVLLGEVQNIKKKFVHVYDINSTIIEI